ncbi:axonal fasciculation [Desmophyllum pertusum]|uniref:Axonal fasciculation n=1 Tax=Desmophyllum pertusum TaxID=174260 RepID=A0A9W9YBX5_9CNID|nr:axonal fasciculation [Desmophyllum pertusum]
MGTIKVGVFGYPDPSFSWKKDGRLLNTAANSCQTVLKDGSLKICKVTKSDRGNYTVVIEQASSEDDVKIEVFAVAYANIESFSRPQRFLTVDYPAIFMCKATGFPAPKYKWLSPDGNEITSIGNIKVQDGNLTFTTIEETKEKIGEDRAVVEVMEVFEAPSIDPSQGGQEELKRGEDYKLKCVATGNPLPDVTWLRDGVRDPRQQQTKGQAILEIENAQVSDSGEYTCVARNLAVDSNGNAIVKELVKTINVKSPPFVDKIASPGTVCSYMGNSDPTLVQCKFDGYPKPWVIMTFGDKLMSNATTTAIVKVTTDALRYFGLYKCYAKNEFGFKNHTVELKTAGKPSEVINFRAIPTCNSITLTWRPPTDDGCMPINKYVLEYKGITRNIDGDDKTYTIKDLKQNTKYSISLRATSKAEWGPRSSVEAQTTTYCAPGRPIIYSPASNLLNVGTLTLMWRAPEETGGDDDITYTVRYRVEKDKNTGNHGAWKTITTKNLQVEISELDNKVSYKFEVTAKNKGGTSGPAEKYIQTNFPGKRSSQARLVSSTFLTISVGGIFLLL